MPIYVKENNNWQKVDTTAAQANPSLYIKNGFTWREIRSGWVKKDGNWQQFYQKNSLTKDWLKSYVFIGDGNTWGWGLAENLQYTSLIQNHINLLRGNFNSGKVYRALHYDDATTTPPQGGYNGTLKIAAKSSGVQYLSEGPFGWYKGSKAVATYEDPLIYVPPGEYIDYIIPAGDRNLCIILDETSSYTITSTGDTFAPLGGSPVNFFSAINNLNIGFSDSEFNFTNKTGCTLRIAGTAPNGFKLYSIGTSQQTFLSGPPPYTWAEVMVIARQGWSVADYADAVLDIKRSVYLKGYFEPSRNAPPVYIIAAGSNDAFASSRITTPAVYKTNLEKIITGLLTTQNIYYRKGEVVLTTPLKFPSASIVYPAADYYNAVYDLANKYSLHYVDLNCLGLTAAHYLDGIHLNASGSVKVANKYIEDLGLGAIDSSGNEIIASWRGL